MTTWIAADQFSELIGKTDRHARRILARFARGTGWNGMCCKVRPVKGRGGRSGVRYEVLLSSLPEALQRALNGDALPALNQPEPLAVSTYVSRLPTHSARALELFERIKSATGDHLTAAQRGQAVREIVARTGIPRRTVERYDALAELAGAIGEAAALALAMRFGGTRLYVPRTIGDNHPICVALGRTDADHLAAWAGGGAIEVPKQAARRARVHALRSRGALTISQIALETAYSERHVYRLLRGDGDERQISIFDIL